VEGRDRIYVSQQYHDKYKDLVKAGTFRTMRDLLLLSAAVGFRLKKRVPLESRQGVFSVNVLSDRDVTAFIRSLAIAETGDVQVLMDPDAMYTILEEYANGGLEIVIQYIEQPGVPSKNLVEFLLRPPIALQLMSSEA
jgi:dnd system-associated protein 4